MHYLIYSLLRKRITVFIIIEGTISLNDTGQHILYLLNTATQTEASDIRNIHNPTRFCLTIIVMLALHWWWKRRCGSRMENNSIKRFCVVQAVNALSGGRSCVIGQRHHTTSRHHCDKNVNKLWVGYNWNATNDWCEVLKIVHVEKVRYYRWSKIYCDVLWISIIHSEAIWIIEYKTIYYRLFFLSVR